MCGRGLKCVAEEVSGPHGSTITRTITNNLKLPINYSHTNKWNKVVRIHKGITHKAGENRQVFFFSI